MKGSLSLLALALTASASPLSFLTNSAPEQVLSQPSQHTLTRPSVDEAAVQARKLIKSEAFADMNTVFQSGPLAGSAIGLLEYYADCSEDGSLTLLMVEVGHNYKNWLEGSPVSFSIKYSPKFFSLSPASEPRASLVGNISYVEDEEEIKKAKLCFLHRHPDAKAWLPGNKIHKTAFMTFVPESVYWLGGFGNVAYIGDIPIDMYKNVTLDHPHPSLPHFPPHHGDGPDDGDDEYEPKHPNGERPPYGADTEGQAPPPPPGPDGQAPPPPPGPHGQRPPPPPPHGPSGHEGHYPPPPPPPHGPSDHDGHYPPPPPPHHAPSDHDGYYPPPPPPHGPSDHEGDHDDDYPPPPPPHHGPPSDHDDDDDDEEDEHFPHFRPDPSFRRGRKPHFDDDDDEPRRFRGPRRMRHEFEHEEEEDDDEEEDKHERKFTPRPPRFGNREPSERFPGARGRRPEGYGRPGPSLRELHGRSQDLMQCLHEDERLILDSDESTVVDAIRRCQKLINKRMNKAGKKGCHDKAGKKTHGGEMQMPPRDGPRRERAMQAQRDDESSVYGYVRRIFFA
ncbi:pyridoxamine 5'-phosphate oxidase-domain-containing protein [Myxozyma melibiosi]|uniref:Pyridoxamine 5'-phosphate oxidase-domain-containing protein n=1 Tax=Myxozyma melibiosi TaxID=54550 RepID=A0ABR1F3S7_9ASCO